MRTSFYKRSIVLLCSICLSVSLFAQNKGDKYIAGALNADFSKVNAEIFDGTYYTRSSRPIDSAFELQFELAYFALDNLRLSVALGANYGSNPSTQDTSDNWLFTNSNSFSFNPNVAYYIKLFDKVYYTPEVGVSMYTGKYLTEVSQNVFSKYNTSGLNFYASILAFEFILNDRFALGVVSGTLSYAMNRYDDKTTGESIIAKEGSLSLNNGFIAFRFYW